jgi:hypothetical protein
MCLLEYYIIINEMVTKIVKCVSFTKTFLLIIVTSWVYVWIDGKR